MDPRHVFRKDGDAPGRDLEDGRDRGDEAGTPLAFGNHEFPDALVTGCSCTDAPGVTPKPPPDGSRRPEIDGVGHARNQAGINRR